MRRRRGKKHTTRNRTRSLTSEPPFTLSQEVNETTRVKVSGLLQRDAATEITLSLSFTSLSLISNLSHIYITYQQNVFFFLSLTSIKCAQILLTIYSGIAKEYYLYRLLITFTHSNNHIQWRWTQIHKLSMDELIFCFTLYDFSAVIYKQFHSNATFGIMLFCVSHYMISWPCFKYKTHSVVPNTFIKYGSTRLEITFDYEESVIHDHNNSIFWMESKLLPTRKLKLNRELYKEHRYM